MQLGFCLAASWEGRRLVSGPVSKRHWGQPSGDSFPNKKDAISGALSMYFEGVEVPASSDELKGLETLAVWAHPHIVERLEAQLAGRASSFAQSVAVVT